MRTKHVILLIEWIGVRARFVHLCSGLLKCWSDLHKKLTQSFFTTDGSFLQRVSIACYAKRCILSDRLTV